MKLLNNTARVIFVSAYALVPSRPCEVGNIEELMEKVPRLAELIKSGDVQKISAAKAKKTEQLFEKNSLSELKKAAEDNGLDTAQAKTKQDYIDLLKG